MRAASMLDRPRADQYVVVTGFHGRPPSWTWEIQRRPEALGIKVYGTDFKTESAAKLAGEKALVAFLDGLAKEERGGDR
jgi:hypothetical protein